MLLKSGWSYEYLKLPIDAVRFVMEHPLLTASTGGMLETVDAPQPPPMTLLQMLESLERATERLIKGREAAMKLVRLNIAAADQAQKILDANRV